MSRKTSRNIIKVLTFILVTAILFPVMHFDSRALGFETPPGMVGDLMFNRLVMLLPLPFGIFGLHNTHWMNHPFGEELGFAVANSLHLVAYIPLGFFFGPVSSYNLLFIMVLLLNFITFRKFAADVLETPEGAFFAALIFAFNPYVGLKACSGFLQKAIVFWIPLFLREVYLFTRSGKTGHVVRAIIFLLLMQFTYPPYALFAGVFVTIMFLVSFVYNPLRNIRLLPGLLVIFLLSSVTALGIYRLMGFDFGFFREMALMNPPSGPPDPDGNLDLFHIFHFHPYFSSHLLTWLHLGIPVTATIMIIPGFFRRGGKKFLLLVTALFFLFIAAGPVLMNDGRMIEIGSRPIYLPFWYLSRLIPMVSGMKYPIRTLPYFFTSFALLAGIGMDGLASGIEWTGWKRKSALVLIPLVFYIGEMHVSFPEYFPPEIHDVHVPGFLTGFGFSAEKGLVGKEAILNLPLSWHRRAINSYGFYTFMAGYRMVNPYFEEHCRISVPSADAPLAKKTDFLKKLKSWHVRMILVHEKFMSNEYVPAVPKDRFSWLDSFCKSENHEEDGIIVYYVPETETGDPVTVGMETEEKGKESMVYIPGGGFEMGAASGDYHARKCERPAHEVKIDPFYIDKYEVTVEEYRKAVEAGIVTEPSCPASNETEKYLCNWNKPERASHPVNGVSWYQADAYCRWLGKRLPTEAEFEYLLRDGGKDMVFPWGNGERPPDGFGNYVDENSIMKFKHWFPIPGYRDAWHGTAPVGSFKPDRFGVYDISGNIWEWCSDWFDPRFYSHSPIENPTGPSKGIHRSMRGGGFHCDLYELRVSERHHKPPSDASFYAGFRCAGDVRDEKESR